MVETNTVSTIVSTMAPTHPVPPRRAPPRRAPRLRHPRRPHRRPHRFLHRNRPPPRLRGQRLPLRLPRFLLHRSPTSRFLPAARSQGGTSLYPFVLPPATIGS